MYNNIHDISSSSDECNITGVYDQNVKLLSLSESDDSLPDLCKRIKMNTHVQMTDFQSSSKLPTNTESHININLSSEDELEVLIKVKYISNYIPRIYNKFTLDLTVNIS